ncbi:hypothetical protein DYB35_004826 [Aphanomyces astaci]|uniref:non-specific serine/threonine protein kinase n=1 Tax=Aphanomyces astaci TaxID=112090 RepID=A0A418DPS4_APHAT|nr:hypothetical protein DYB35_004826 [Aphanomyces astaci]
MSRRERIVGNHYQLGLEIGKGGFGTVFSALDLRNGKSVAIKQVSLIDMAKEELAAIESEIKLLKKLHHENIVKYYNTIKEEDYLYIVLEYMENGSLAQFMKKFGTLSETLVAMYITQVLRGLAYLHAQVNYNVLLPSANILTTKDGLVKIADFGVAIKLNEAQKSNSVSSSHGCRSVGCTIIELLTQKPPYFDLAPMAALFRIVQDDHPPLPKSISPALHDFIMKCFMKEPRLRLSADDLLLHPWISQIPRTKVEQSTQEVQDNVTSTDDRAAVLNTIRMYDTITRDSTSSCLEAMHEDDDESWDAIPKNDTCRLFVKLGVLPKLIAVYNRLVLAIFKQHSMQLVDELHKICDIFLLFSQGDVVVKEHMCDLVVLEGLLYSLNPGTAIAKHDAYSMATVKILKCIRNMSMEPNTLENLDRAGTIPTLVQVLTDESSPQIKVRHLLGFTDTLACDGVTFFLTLLSDKFWQIDAMKAIAAWLALGRSSLFVMEILYRLSYPKPFVRKNLLKMLKCIFESHTAPVQFLVEFNIHPTILALAQETNQILIQEIASQLLQAILVSASVF